jgi:hypothetical protein
MPEIVCLSDSKKAAFSRGFWKGMAAPLMLFSTFDMSAQPVEQTFQELPNRASEEGSDWIRVGDALRMAAKQDRELGGK